MSSWRKHCMLMCMRRQNKDDDAISLDYRHSNLSDVPSDVFTHERTLEELHLDSNHIRDLPRELFYCQSLQYLFMSDNELIEVPSMIGSLVHLEQLNISRNGIVRLPDTISACKNLSILEASVNPLGKIPEGLTRLVGLVELYLNDAFLDSLPNSFGRLSQLKVLELRENHLQTLPNSLVSLSKLCRLDLGTNDFQRLPDVLSGLIGLQELWLDNNRLTGISKVIDSLQKLTFFDASKNSIETIAPEIENCISLTDIHLSTNQLLYLPESIGRLSSVVTLKLNDNCLASLPFSIGGLVSLTELDISSNSLEELPIGVGLLRHLRTLYADDNFLTYLPAELGSCSRLTILSLRTNNLANIPDEIGRIPNLHVLNLSDNKLRSLPFGLMKLKNLTALWLADNQTKPLVKLQTETDSATGQRVLSCYLLPQQTHAVPDDDYDSEIGSSFHPSAWEERLKRRQIQFEFDETSLQEHQHLRRTPTPYPKELKRRLQCSRERALSDRLMSTGSGARTLGDSVVRGRRSERLNGARVSADRAVDGRCIRSPLVTERHVLLKADKEKHLRDKFRMQHSTEAVVSSDRNADDQAGSNVDDSVLRMQADRSTSSVTADRISSEEIRPLDKSPQRSGTVRGRRDGATPANVTSPSHVHSQGSTDLTCSSPEKAVSGHTSTRSPTQVAGDSGDHALHDGRLHFAQTGGSRPSGYASDGVYKQDRRPRKSGASGRAGYVSDTSFSATAQSGIIDSLRSTAAEDVTRLRNAVRNAEQLDVANNNEASPLECPDSENNNVSLKSAPRSHSGQKNADDGIQIMPYAEFVQSRVEQGLAPPRGVVVRRDGRHVLVPQYVVQQHRHHRAHVRSLRRHGYESEDGRITGRHVSHHGYSSDQGHCNASRHRHRRPTAGHGYESDVGYRSDLASNSRPVPYRTAVYGNSSAHSADFVSHAGSDRAVHRQKVPSSSGFVARSGHGVALHQRDVQETIAEEVVDVEEPPDGLWQTVLRQQWQTTSEVSARNRFTDQSGVNQSIGYSNEPSHGRNRSSSRRRNFEPIEL